MGKAAMQMQKSPHERWFQRYLWHRDLASIREAGGHVQRHLWASGTKNPAFSDVLLYWAVNWEKKRVTTVPDDTLKAFGRSSEWLPILVRKSISWDHRFSAPHWHRYGEGRGSPQPSKRKEIPEEVFNNSVWRALKQKRKQVAEAVL